MTAVPLTLQSWGYSSALVSAIAVYGALVLALWVVGVALWRCLTNVRLARAASAAYDPSAPLRCGHSVLAGEVFGDKSPVRVEITQHGTDTQGDRPTHTWRETARRMRVTPFELQTAAKTRVRIEPSEEQTVLIASLVPHRQTHYRRTMVGELGVGEQVFVVGQLDSEPDPLAERGYREQAFRLVLRAPPSMPLLISKEPLGRRYAARARFHLRWVFWGLTLAAISQSLALVYHRSVLFGRPVVGTITQRKEREIGRGRYRAQWRDLTIRLAGGTHVVVDAAPESFERTRPGQRVALRVVDERRGPLALYTRAYLEPHTAGYAKIYPLSVQLGAWPTAHFTAVAGAPAIALLSFFWFRARRARSRPWYEQRRLEQTYPGLLTG